MSKTNLISGLILPGKGDPERSGDNFQKLLEWSQKISPVMYAIDGAILNTPPKPPFSGYGSIEGVQSVVFTAGAGVLTLPKAFLNGWLSLTMNPDAGPYALSWSASGPPAVTLSAIAVFASGSPSATVHVSYRAVGW